MLPKLFFTEIAQDCNFPDRIGPGDLRQPVQREAQDAHACPAPTRASQPDLGLIAGKTNSREAAKLRPALLLVRWACRNRALNLCGERCQMNR